MNLNRLFETVKRLEREVAELKRRVGEVELVAKHPLIEVKPDDKLHVVSPESTLLARQAMKRRG